MIEYPSAAVDVFTQHTDTTGAAAAHEHRERKTKIKAPLPLLLLTYISYILTYLAVWTRALVICITVTEQQQ